MGELTTETAAEVPAVTHDNPLAQAIAATSPERIVSAEGAAALEALYGVYERDQTRQAKRAFAAAMSRVVQAAPEVLRAASNPQTRSRYAKHEHIARALKPLYTAEGFSLSITEEDCPIEGWKRFVGVLMHQDGYEQRYHVDLPLDAVGIKGQRNKTDLHAAGSTITYARGRLAQLIWDVTLVDDHEDDDGVAAAAPPITDQQAADLAALIEDVGADLKRFLKFFGIANVAELPAARYHEAVQRLEQRRRAAK